MININTILSVFDSKGTLLKWLKEVDKAIEDSALTDVTLTQDTPDTFKLSFVFVDGSSVDTPVISMPKNAFRIIYDETLYSAISTALADNLIPYCIYNNKLYIYSYIDTYSNIILSCVTKTNTQFISISTYSTYTTSISSSMINPMTASGDIIYGGISGIPTRLAKGSNGYVLTIESGVPKWKAPSGGGTQLYKHTFSVGLDDVIYVITNQATMEWSSVYGGYQITGFILDCAYYKFSNSATFQATPRDGSNSHGPTDWYWKYIDYKEAGLDVSLTLDGTELHSVSAL